MISKGPDVQIVGAIVLRGNVSGELRRDDWPVGFPHFEPPNAEGRLKEPAFTFVDEAYQYLAIDGPPNR